MTPHTAGGAVRRRGGKNRRPDPPQLGTQDPARNVRSSSNSSMNFSADAECVGFQGFAFQASGSFNFSDYSLCPWTTRGEPLTLSCGPLVGGQVAMTECTEASPVEYLKNVTSSLCLPSPTLIWGREEPFLSCSVPTPPPTASSLVCGCVSL